jgi:hypothetical protein
MYEAPIEDLEKVVGKSKTPNLRKQIKKWLDEKA